MRKEIYETIVGIKQGYVINVNYNSFLHWSCSDSSLIILGKGEHVQLSIDNDILTIVSNNNGLGIQTTEINLNDLNESIDVYECIFNDYLDNKVIIIKSPLIVDQLDLEGVIYTENVFTADILIKHFCDRIDFNTEIVVPINNLRILNDMIKNHNELIKFVKHIKINNVSALAIVTKYNAEYEVKKALNKLYTQVDNNEYDEECRAFVRQCKLESSTEIKSENELNNLMKLYSEISENENTGKKTNKYQKYAEADEAYMHLYNQLKNGVE